jgi:hypothetical protein
MKQILTAFLMLCLIPLYLHPAEKVESGKKLYDENIEGRKKLYEQNFGDGKELTEQTKEWVKEDIENMGDWEYKIVAFGGKATTGMGKALDQLGNERWQCFWVESSGKDKSFISRGQRRATFKRFPPEIC